MSSLLGLHQVFPLDSVWGSEDHSCGASRIHGGDRNKLNLFQSPPWIWAEISENEITFLDTVVFKGEIDRKAILDIKTHYKPTETFQYTHFTSCHPPGVKRGFIKGKAIRLLRTNSSKGLITWRISAWLAGLKFQPGFWNKFLWNQIGDYMKKDSARANGLKSLKKSHVIETEFQPGLKSRKYDGCRYEVEAISVE